MGENNVERLFAYNKVINSNFSIMKDSITVPSCVREIIEICAYIDNGTNHSVRGFLSIFNEKTNEQLLNSTLINNDKRHYNQKRVVTHHFPRRNNMSFVLDMAAIDKTQPLRLVILFKYRK